MTAMLSHDARMMVHELRSVSAEVLADRCVHSIPSPAIRVRVAGECSFRVLAALGHRVAAEVELAMIDEALESVVTLREGQVWWEKRARMGGEIVVEIEVIDGRKMKLAEEVRRAVKVLAAVAAKINETK